MATLIPYMVAAESSFIANIANILHIKRANITQSEYYTKNMVTPVSNFSYNADVLTVKSDENLI